MHTLSQDSALTLINVKDERGDIIFDKYNFRETKGFAKLNPLEAGSLLSFDARIRRHSQNYFAWVEYQVGEYTSELIIGHRLVYPKNVVLLRKPSRRIGRLERWILIHAYLKKQDKLPEDWQRPRYYDSVYVISDYLSKAEILLNYFHLEISQKRPAFRKPKVAGGDDLLDREHEKFKTTPKYKSALVSYTRTRDQLLSKGLIDIREIESASTPSQKFCP